MSLSEQLVLEADLELFRSEGPGAPTAANARHWGLGFGPVGGTRPVWGLYLFQGASRTPLQRQLFWLLTPTEAELRRWCVRTVGPRLATRLLTTVGDVTVLYAQYFASRPDMQGCPHATMHSGRSGRRGDQTAIAPVETASIPLQTSPRVLRLFDGAA